MEADLNESLKTIIRKVYNKNWRSPAYVAKEKSVISPEKQKRKHYYQFMHSNP